MKYQFVFSQYFEFRALKNYNSTCGCHSNLKQMSFFTLKMCSLWICNKANFTRGGFPGGLWCTVTIIVNFSLDCSWSILHKYLGPGWWSTQNIFGRYVPHKLSNFGSCKTDFWSKIESIELIFLWIDISGTAFFFKITTVGA